MGEMQVGAWSHQQPSLDPHDLGMDAAAREQKTGAQPSLAGQNTHMVLLYPLVITSTKQ